MLSRINMAKKIIVNEDILRHLLMEMAKDLRLISEISVSDAYTKFYNGKVPEDVYNTLMAGTDVLTPLHRQALDIMTKNLGPAMPIATAVSNAWTNARREVRQSLIDAAKNKELDLAPVPFIQKIQSICKKRWHTENEMSSGGLKVLYEDEYLRITCTLTYASSTKNYSHTHWCTASDIYGQFNGFGMFLRYAVNANACLIQFVNKSNGTDFVQAQYFADERGETRDFYDNSMSRDGFENFLLQCYPQNIVDDGTVSSGFYEMFTRVFNGDTNNIPFHDVSLIAETKKAVEEELPYWQRKTQARVDRIKGEMNEKYWNNEQFINEMLNATSREFNDGEYSYDDVDFSSDDGEVYAYGYRYPNRSYAVVHFGFGVSDDLEDWLSSCDGVCPDSDNIITSYAFLIELEPQEAPRVLQAFKGALSVNRVERALLVCYAARNRDKNIAVIDGLTGKNAFGGFVQEAPINFGTHHAFFYDLEDEKLINVIDMRTLTKIATIYDAPELHNWIGVERATVVRLAPDKRPISLGQLLGIGG